MKEGISYCVIVYLVYKELDNEFLKKARREHLSDGTTCLVTLLLNGRLVVANVGDSSAILVRNSKMLELTKEQVPSRMDEYKRITSNSGLIIPVGQTLRVQGVLSVTRAIGDINYKDYLISEPETNSIQISPLDDFLILSTDGLY